MISCSHCIGFNRQTCSSQILYLSNSTKITTNTVFFKIYQRNWFSKCIVKSVFSEVPFLGFAAIRCSNFIGCCLLPAPPRVSTLSNQESQNPDTKIYLNTFVPIFLNVYIQCVFSKCIFNVFNVYFQCVFSKCISQGVNFIKSRVAKPGSGDLFVPTPF